MDEFGGRSNRHSECTDCHNPHKATLDVGDPGRPTGWTASGRITQNSGVQVTNGAAGQPRRPTPSSTGTRPPRRSSTSCASSATRGTRRCPPTPVSSRPSTPWTRGSSSTPHNPSYHPVEATGNEQHRRDGREPRGHVAVQAVELHDWQHDPVHELPCQFLGRSPGGAKPAGGRGPSHAHVHQPRDPARQLPGPCAEVIERPAYAAERLRPVLPVPRRGSPFRNESSTATNFRGPREAHERASRARASTAWGRTSTRPVPAAATRSAPSATSGSTRPAFPAGTQNLAGSRLVSFSPNVTGVGTGNPPTFTKSANGGSCTLTCHGKAARPPSRLPLSPRPVASGTQPPPRDLRSIPRCGHIYPIHAHRRIPPGAARTQTRGCAGTHPSSAC